MIDRGAFAAGIVLIAFGTLLLLDRVGALDLRFAYFWPTVLAVVGSILLALGLTKDSG